MLPYSLPSSVSAFGRRQMRAYPYTPQAGDVAWVDYIPVRFVPDNFQEGTYNQKGFVAIDIISSPTGRQAWVDYVPIVIDDTRTDAWLVNRVGYIPVNFSGTGDGTAANKGLSLNFVGADKLDPRITFSRASNATVTGSNGLIQYAPHNLLTFSEQFDNAAWSKTASTITANATAAPDGTITADKLVEDTSNSLHLLGQTTNPRPLSNPTISVYAKASERNWLFLNLFPSNPNDFSNDTRAYFDLSNGTVGTVIRGTANIVSVGNGWYRCSLTASQFTSTASTRATSAIHVALADGTNSYTGNGVSGIFIWGAQLEEGSTATAYNPTTVKNLLGFSEAFDNAAWTKSNSFIQTNLLTFSEQFDNAAWTKSSSTVTANTIVAPNGTTTADVLNIQSNLSNIQQTTSLGAGTYTFSIWVRTVSVTTGTTIRLLVVADGTTQSLTITPTAEWVRYSFTFTAATSVTAVQAIRGLTLEGNIAIWGAQLVQGSVAGDYQQTTSAALPVMYQAPNGTMTADKLVENTANSSHAVGQETNPRPLANPTISVYAKAGERNWLFLNVFPSSPNDFSNDTRAYFDLTNGTVGTVTRGTAAIVSVGNGWYRCSLTASQFSSTASARASSYIHVASANNTITYTGDGTSGIYIWGAQLSDSASLDTYVNNPVAAPSSTAYYGPRFDYDPVTLQPRGLLIEEQRTNLLLQSENFSASWSLLRVTNSADATTAPNGTNTADQLLDTAVSGTHVAIQTITKAASAITYTASVYLKPNVRTLGELRVSDQAGNGVRNTFNLTAGTVGTPSTFGTGFTAGTSTITAVGNGWYRMDLVATTNSATTLGHEIYIADASGNTSYTGNGSGFFVWGAQLEAGAFATSYIPTTSAQVTRSADVALVQGTNFSSWYNVNEGSMFTNTISLYPNDSTTNSSGVISFNIDASNSNHIGLDPRRVRVVTGGVSQANITSISAIPSGLYRTAFAYATNDVVITTNNSAILSDTSVTLPSGFNRMAIGRGLALDGILNGHIRQIAYYPRRLSNSELQAITS